MCPGWCEPGRDCGRNAQRTYRAPTSQPAWSRGARDTNAIQIYPWSEGALYQVYAAVGQITTIALEPGENLTGAGRSQPVTPHAGSSAILKAALADPACAGDG